MGSTLLEYAQPAVRFYKERKRGKEVAGKEEFRRGKKRERSETDERC